MHQYSTEWKWHWVASSLMQPGHQQHAQSQHAKPSPWQLRVPKQTGNCVCFNTDVRYRNHCCCKVVWFFRKQTYTTLQRSAIVMVLYFQRAPPSTRSPPQAYCLWNVLPSPTSQTVKLYKVYFWSSLDFSLYLSQPAIFLCPSPPILPPRLPALFFYPLCCRSPTLMLLLDSCPLGPQPGPSLTININQRRCQ